MRFKPTQDAAVLARIIGQALNVSSDIAGFGFSYACIDSYQKLIASIFNDHFYFTVAVYQDARGLVVKLTCVEGICDDLAVKKSNLLIALLPVIRDMIQ